MCSDNSILKRQYENEVIVDSTLSVKTLKFKNDSLKKLTQEKREQELERVRRQWTANAYELGFSGFREFKIEDFKDWTLYPMLCFTVFILLSIFVFFFAFKEHLAKVYKISIFNLGLIISSMLIFISKVGFDIIYNIKYGYYLLLLNIIILIILSKRELERNSR
ncbi:hypothetical protein EM308_15140 [Flavobacterium gilvum]|uniref:Uncharacterized protein n=2 Tax=Flavobacterium gilvum TaxID=1492737 RepID=A0AAC9N642_9FLAO|nr:hypothetical protein EM308_15140 [Flavobacterium gilvum]